MTWEETLRELAVLNRLQARIAHRLAVLNDIVYEHVREDWRPGERADAPPVTAEH